jgi:hypothetical protein
MAVASHPACAVAVVDNGSSDDPTETIRDLYPRVRVIRNASNLGYAGGNNVGIRYALAQGADYICILNNDVTVEKGFVLALLSVLQSNSKIGVVTPLIASMEQPEQVWALGSAVNRKSGVVNRLHVGENVSEWGKRTPFAVDSASGAAMLIKREVLENVGLMDEDFFLYFEETDWCLQVRKAGYRIIAVPSSVVYHKVSATLGASSPVIDYYMLRNHLRFVARHWSVLIRWHLQGGIVLRNLATIAAYTAKPHDGSRIPNRNARLFALCDALLGRWGKMGADVEKACYANE